jgi:pseudouridine-5'-phosphate glycosidase
VLSELTKPSQRDLVVAVAEEVVVATVAVEATMVAAAVDTEVVATVVAAEVDTKIVVCIHCRGHGRVSDPYILF